MKAAAFLGDARKLPAVTLREIVQGGIVVIAPHQDDESLGCGGLICQAVDCHVPIRVIFISDGTGSHPNSKSHPAGRLRQLRHDEAVRACTHLGLTREQLLFLNLPDRAVPSEGPLADWAVALIAAQIEEVQAGSMFVTWDQDPHCDHIAAYFLARRAINQLRPAQHRPDLRLYAYPTWAWLGTRTPEIGYAPRGFRLPVFAELDRKRAAIMEHRSQVTNLIDDDPEAFRLPASFLDVMLQPYEVFLDTTAA